MAIQFHTPVEILNKFKNLEITKYEIGEPQIALISRPSKQYQVKLITDNESDAVLQHLRKFFFKDEPLNTAIKLIEFEESKCIELEEYSLKSIKEGNSLMAVAPNGKIIGVCLNGLITTNEETEEDAPCANPKFGKILELLDYCGKEGTNAVLKKYPEIENTIFVKILSTDSEWRGQGIARELLEWTRNIGRKQGCSLMRVDCTSYFSARAIAKLGFECVYEMNYVDYKENGKPVFLTESPHTSFTVYIQKIYEAKSR